MERIARFEKEEIDAYQPDVADETISFNKLRLLSPSTAAGAW
jgi:hypothetical protein